MGEDLRHVHFITEEDPVIRVSQVAEEKNIRMSNKDAQNLRKSREQLRNTPSFIKTH